MRSIEYLVQTYPDKTGKEIMDIAEQEKLDAEKEYQERNKKQLEYINDLNTNGGYFRGRFGADQHYYYRVFNARMYSDSDTVVIDVESVVIFYNSENKPHNVTRPGEISIRRETKTHAKMDTYSLEYEERVTVKEWDTVNEYLNNTCKLFWK